MKLLRCVNLPSYLLAISIFAGAGLSDTYAQDIIAKDAPDLRDPAGIKRIEGSTLSSVSQKNSMSMLFHSKR